jgi:flagellar hook-associated protein 2
MATSATSPSAVATLTAPPTFSGVSKFATSLQQVLTRAVGIASLPLNLDQAQLTTFTTTQTDVQALDTAFTTLQGSLTTLQSALTSGLLTTSLSDASTVTATVGTGATAGSYTIAVGSLGAFSTALSNAGSTPISDPTSQGISTDTSLTLSVGTTTTTITPASNSLQDLVSAINSQAGDQVQATLVNVGSTSSPDYRISLKAANLGTDAIDLTDSSGDLISTSTPGSLASYQIDGLTTPVTSDSRTVTLSPGVTINLIGQSAAGASTTVTVADNPAALASAFSAFAGNYNAALDALSQYHGKNGGALEGSSLVQSLTGVLAQIGTYTTGSPSGSLANFGITVDDTGALSVDTSAFTAAANANLSTLLSTLGGTTSGGFLQAATNLLNGVEDPTTGTLKIEEASVAGEITSQQALIANEQSRVNQLQTNLTQQIATADSAIAGLESQVTFVTGLFAQYTGAGNTQSNGLSTL